MPPVIGNVTLERIKEMLEQVPSHPDPSIFVYMVRDTQQAIDAKVNDFCWVAFNYCPRADAVFILETIKEHMERENFPLSKEGYQAAADLQNLAEEEGW